VKKLGEIALAPFARRYQRMKSRGRVAAAAAR
jgi:hypothetical protein